MLTIYGVPISVHTRKVIVTAILKGLDYQNEPVIPFDPPSGWDAISPTGKIPVITDNGQTIADSSVICTYLDRTYPQHPIYPRDVRPYVQALWIEEYADGTLFREVVYGLFFQMVMRPNLLKQPTDGSLVESIVDHWVPKTFGFLERSLNGEYFAGERLSIADIAVMSNLINYHYLGFCIDCPRFSKLADWFDARLQHPAIATALKAEAPFADRLGLDRRFLVGVTAS